MDPLYLEETFAALAGADAVVLTGRVVAAHGAPALTRPNNAARGSGKPRGCILRRPRTLQASGAMKRGDMLLLGGQQEGVVLGGLVGAVQRGVLLCRRAEGKEGQLLCHSCLMITSHRGGGRRGGGRGGGGSRVVGGEGGIPHLSLKS